MSELHRRAVLYARVSSKEQEEGYSIPAQEKLLRDYAERHGFEVVREFVDVETAKHAGRAQFGEMLKFLRRKGGDCRIVLVEKTDRLYRNFRDYVSLDEFGAEVHLVKEGAVLSKDSRSGDKLMHGFKVVLAKHFIDNLREETTKGMREKAAQGEWPTKAPLGYRNVRGADGRSSLQVDPEGAPHVRRFFERFAAGQCSVKQLTRQAAAEGLVNRKSGRPVADSTVHKLLRNPLFKGAFVWEGKSFAGRHEPLVSAELWERVQGVMNGRRRGNEVRGKRGLPFAQLLTCGHCGCAVTGEAQKGGRYVYYHCTQARGKCPGRYARQEELEERFGEYLRRLRFDAEVLSWVKEALRESHSDEMAFRRETAARLRVQEDRLRARSTLLYDDRLEGRIDAAEYDRRRAEAQTALEGVQRELARLDAAERDYLDEGSLLLELASRSYDLYSAQPVSEKRRLVNLLLSNCTWKDGVLSADYRQPFDLLAVATAEGEGAALAGGASGAERPGWYPIDSALELSPLSVNRGVGLTHETCLGDHSQPSAKRLDHLSGGPRRGSRGGLGPGVRWRPMDSSCLWDRPHWELKGKVDSSMFFRALGGAIPEATTLFIEARPSRDVDAYLRSAVEPGTYLPDRNTTWPKENLYRLPFNAQTLASLADLAERHAEPELLSHMHVYLGDASLLYWHDAFDRGSPALVADTVEADRLRAFASTMGFTLRSVAGSSDPGRDQQKRGCLVVGIALLVIWAAAIATLFTVGMLQHMQLGPQERSVGGAEGMIGGIACLLAIPCGVALLVAYRAQSVRAIRGLRWIVVLGLAMAWFVPIALLLDLFR